MPATALGFQDSHPPTGAAHGCFPDFGPQRIARGAVPTSPHPSIRSSKDGRNRGVRRAWAAVSNAWARPMSRPSLQARPKNERPTGNPKIIPAGSVIDGYPATAAMDELPPRPPSPANNSMAWAGPVVGATVADPPGVPAQQDASKRTARISMMIDPGTDERPPRRSARAPKSSFQRNHSLPPIRLTREDHGTPWANASGPWGRAGSALRRNRSFRMDLQEPRRTASSVRPCSNALE